MYLDATPQYLFLANLVLFSLLNEFQSDVQNMLHRLLGYPCEFDLHALLQLFSIHRLKKFILKADLVGEKKFLYLFEAPIDNIYCYLGNFCRFLSGQ